MNKVAKFEKVSYEQFAKAFDPITLITGKIVTDELIKEMYDIIELPKRATVGSAGYDFITPFDITLAPKESILVPTGIRCKMEYDWFLALLPKSGLGFKFRCQLDNSMGVVDSDYYYSDNEGHIMAKITNDTNDFKTLRVAQGKGFMQGLFLPYGITIDDETNGIRNGGFGSTAS